MACGCDLNQLSFVGLVGMCDPPRPGVKAAIEELLNGEVDVKMITGDAKETGEAIGKPSTGLSSASISSNNMFTYSCSQVVSRYLRVPPSLSLLPVLASYISELKPTSTGAPVALYKPEAWTVTARDNILSYINSKFLEGCAQLCWLACIIIITP